MIAWCKARKRASRNKKLYSVSQGVEWSWWCSERNELRDRKGSVTLHAIVEKEGLENMTQQPQFIIIVFVYRELFFLSSLAYLYCGTLYPTRAYRIHTWYLRSILVYYYCTAAAAAVWMYDKLGALGKFWESVERCRGHTFYTMTVHIIRKTQTMRIRQRNIERPWKKASSSSAVISASQREKHA